MQLAMIGLGKMGANMTERLLRGGHQVVAYDLNAQAVAEAEAVGAQGVTSLEALVGALPTPRTIWMMVPAGRPVELTIQALRPLLQPGDLLIDGGNSNYRETMSRAAALHEDGLHYMDVGVSGGIWGLKVGYCLMAGATDEDFDRIEPALQTLATENGYAHVGPVGAGHYTKMVHNGIEYGMMQAYAEGFDLLAQKAEFHLDLAQVAALWNHGSVVRSWLLELAQTALQQDPGLDGILGYVPDSGEGRWTVQESIDLAVPAPVITLALQMRFVSRRENSFSARLLAALRNQFGGHAVQVAEPKDATSVESEGQKPTPVKPEQPV